jgi:hypothetical protein
VRPVGRNGIPTHKREGVLHLSLTAVEGRLLLSSPHLRYFSYNIVCPLVRSVKLQSPLDNVADSTYYPTRSPPKGVAMTGASPLRYSGRLACVLSLLTFISNLVPAQEEQRADHMVALYKELYERYDNSQASLRPSSDSVLTFLGRWPWGPCVAVAAKGNHAFITNGPMFQSLHVSDPTTPTIVGEYEAWVGDIFVRDSVAFLASNGLLILNISDPTNPSQISYLPLTSGVARVVVEGNFAYLLTTSGLLRVIDISNIYAPYLRGVIPAGGDVPRSIAVRNAHVYVGDVEFPRLSIVNATNPDSLWRREIIGGFVYSLYAVDTTLYVGRWPMFQTYTISDPMNPVLLGSVNVSDKFLSAITVDGTTAYIATDTAGIYAVDVSNPLQPIVVDSIKPTSPAVRTGLSITTEGENIFAAQYVGLWTVRKDSLSEQSYFRTGEQAARVFIKDHLAYVASGRAGLWIVDISDPSRPVGISNVNKGSYTCDVVVEDGTAYLMNYSQSLEDTQLGVWSVDVSNPHAPIVLAQYIGIARYSGTHFNSLALVGNLLFLSQAGAAFQPQPYDSTLEIIDISNPSQLASVGVFRSPHRSYYVAARESIACLATPSGGLRIVDWSTPALPTEVATFQNSIRGIAVDGSLAYAARSDTFFVLSLANPTLPTLLGKYGRMSSGGFTSANLFVERPFVYWATGQMGVIDVSEPTNPRPLTIVQGPRGVAASDRVVVAAASSSGIWIFRNDHVVDVPEGDGPALPEHPSLHQNYPNPFNSLTIMRFSLPSRVPVVLEVFDVLGRKIETVLSSVVEAGEHTIAWEAASRSSGVYLYRLTTGTMAITRPMVLIK